MTAHGGELEPDDDAGGERVCDQEESKGPGEQATWHFDELSAIGFALAKSAMLLPEFSNSRAKNCIDAAWLKPMTGVCSPADREELASCMNTFFTKLPVLQSTPPNQNKDNARVLKTPNEIQQAWVGGTPPLHGRRPTAH